MIDRVKVSQVGSLFVELGLLRHEELRALQAFVSDACPLADALNEADSVHVHGRVDDTAAMPHAAIRAGGGQVENEREGYIKYAFEGGVNMIYSSIDVAEDDRLPAEHRLARPHLDHVGIDLRREQASVKALFDAVPARARALGWRHAAQGNAEKPVYCCHTSVQAKHWVYPNGGDAFTRPIEIAYGPLEIHAGKMGCDLRPIDPAHPLAAQAVCGAHGAHDEEAPTDGYYARADLGRFGEVGKFASPTWDKFLAYYTQATATDGALTKREKALIGLAVAHSKQCPYCIDAYTQSCVDSGANVEQMHEAVHVAAALAAGIDLVHATQMHGALRRKGAL